MESWLFFWQQKVGSTSSSSRLAVLYFRQDSVQLTEFFIFRQESVKSTESIIFRQAFSSGTEFGHGYTVSTDME